MRLLADPHLHGLAYSQAPDDARKVYDAFMEDIKQKYKPEKIQQGRVRTFSSFPRHGKGQFADQVASVAQFQSMMDVQLNSDVSSAAS